MKWHCKNFKWNKCWNTKEPKASSPCFIFSAQRCIFKEAGSIERGDRSFLKLYTVLHHRFYYSDNSYPRNLPAQVLFHNAEFIIFFYAPSGEGLKLSLVRNWTVPRISVNTSFNTNLWDRHLEGPEWPFKGHAQEQMDFFLKIALGFKRYGESKIKLQSCACWVPFTGLWCQSNSWDTCN